MSLYNKGLTQSHINLDLMKYRRRELFLRDVDGNIGMGIKLKAGKGNKLFCFSLLTGLLARTSDYSNI